MKKKAATEMQSEKDEDADWGVLDLCRKDIDAIDAEILSLLGLKNHLPDVSIESVESTSLAAKMAADDANGGALGSRFLAESRGLKLLREDIEDEPHNVTRFLLVGNSEPPSTGKDKTTLLFFLGHRPGALAEVLSALAKKDINVCRIESRPMRMRSWEYLFFVDLEGHWEDRVMADAMAEMKTLCVFIKWLGSYPSGGVS